MFWMVPPSRRTAPTLTPVATAAASAWRRVNPLRLGTAVSEAGSGALRAMAGDLGERFGGQVVQMLGAAEHRSERIFRCVSEERRSQRRRWAAWAPKIRRGHPAAAANPGSRDQDLQRTARD